MSMTYNAKTGVTTYSAGDPRAPSSPTTSAPVSVSSGAPSAPVSSAQAPKNVDGSPALTSTEIAKIQLEAAQKFKEAVSQDKYASQEYNWGSPITSSNTGFTVAQSQATPSGNVGFTVNQPKPNTFIAAKTAQTLKVGAGQSLDDYTKQKGLDSLVVSPYGASLESWSNAQAQKNEPHFGVDWNKQPAPDINPFTVAAKSSMLKFDVLMQNELAKSGSESANVLAKKIIAQDQNLSNQITTYNKKLESDTFIKNITPMPDATNDNWAFGIYVPTNNYSKENPPAGFVSVTEKNMFGGTYETFIPESDVNKPKNIFGGTWTAEESLTRAWEPALMFSGAPLVSGALGIAGVTGAPMAVKIGSSFIGSQVGQSAISGALINPILGTGVRTLQGKETTFGDVGLEFASGAIGGGAAGFVGSVLAPQAITTTGKILVGGATGGAFGGVGEASAEFLRGEKYSFEQIGISTGIGFGLGAGLTAMGVGAKPFVEKYGKPTVAYAKMETLVPESTKYTSVSKNLGLKGEYLETGVAKESTETFRWVGVGWEKSGKVNPIVGIGSSPKGVFGYQGAPDFKLSGYPKTPLLSSAEQGIFREPSLDYLEKTAGKNARTLFETYYKIADLGYPVLKSKESSFVSDKDLLKISEKNPDLFKALPTIFEETNKYKNLFGIKSAQAYGSTPAKADIEATSKGTFTRVSQGDIDLFLSGLSKEQSNTIAKNVVSSLKSQGMSVRVAADTSLIEVKGTSGWHNLADLHADADLVGRMVGSMQSSPMSEYAGAGYKSQDWLISSDKRPIMRESEFLVRKVSSSTGFSGTGFGPESQRLKDLVDIPVAARDLAKFTKSGAELTSLANQAETLAPKVFPAIKGMTGSVKPIFTTSSPRVSTTIGSIAGGIKMPSTPNKKIESFTATKSLSPSPSLSIKTISSFFTNTKSQSASSSVYKSPSISLSKSLSPSPSKSPSVSPSLSLSPSASQSLSPSPSPSPSKSISTSVSPSKSIYSPSVYSPSLSKSLYSPSASPYSPSKPSKSPPPIGSGSGFDSKLPSIGAGLGSISSVLKFGKSKSKILVQSSPIRRTLYGESNVLTTKKTAKLYSKALQNEGLSISFPTAEEFKSFIKGIPKRRKKK